MRAKLAVLERNNKDFNIDALQSAGQVALDASNANEMARGVLLDTDSTAGSIAKNGIAFTGGTAKQLAHKLGVIPRGFLVVDAVSGYPVFRRTAADNATITLQAQNTCTVKLWVFV